MKILYVHQYFKTPEEGGSIRSYYLAKGLVDAGHEVTMITAHDEAYIKTQVEGIEVRYLPVPYANSFGFLKRIKAFWAFVRLARREAKALDAHDLAYVMTTPLTTGFIATFLKKRLNLPYYFEVGDLWPEVPIRMGIITHPWLKRWLYRLEKRFYDQAEKVIALSPAIRDYITQDSPRCEVHVIPNISDCTYFDARYSDGPFSDDNKLEVTYCGAMGRANHLEFLLEAARATHEAALPVHFNIIGEGSEKSRLQKQSERLKNIAFFPHSSKQCIRNILNKSDAVYVSFKDVEVLSTGSPNKFFDSLAAGKLTIINFGGWLKAAVEENECGFSYDPHQPGEFVRKLSSFIYSPEHLMRYQKNGRALAERHYERGVLVKNLLEILKPH